MEKCLIVAIADNNAIGRKNALLWNLPDDMKYFRETTTGHPVIMGWMTFQSIGRPLPKRKNIVISIFPWPDKPEKVVSVTSLKKAFREASRRPDGTFAKSSEDDGRKCFVIGGAYTYAEALPLVDTLYITHVHDTVTDADAFFPKIDPAVWKEVSRSPMKHDEKEGVDFEFVVYRKR